jgi:hypothetical protein
VVDVDDSLVYVTECAIISAIIIPVDIFQSSISDLDYRYITKNRLVMIPWSYGSESGRAIARIRVA